MSVFPDPCGDYLRQLVANGADPKTFVPDHWIVVRGGLKPIPPAGSVISATTGPDSPAAGCALPHGNFRFTTAGAIRSAGGVVEWVPELSARGTINYQHINVVETGASSFGEPVANPVVRRDRIDMGI